MSINEFDKAKAEAFAGRMISTLNGGMLALVTSIGHQTGLFDVMANLPPSTSNQIAEKAGLKERYVREWLGAMVTGGIVEYNPANATHKLPPEHAVSLTRSAGSDNLAVFTQYISLLGNVEERVAECFRKGGGVPYSAYPRFQRLNADESDTRNDAILIEKVLPLIPGLAERLQAGIEVLDIGCGRGHAINLMAEAFPKSNFSGYDISKEGIDAGRNEAGRLGLPNVSFEVKDVTKVDVVGRYDLITAFDAIHDQAQPTKALIAISKALRPDGVFLMVDIAASSNLHENLEHPLAPLLYTFSTMHCMTVSLADNGEGWGTMWGEQVARQKLKEAGFTKVDVQRVEGDVFNNYFIARKT